ncbi:glycosyltransferase family 8 protein [Enterococcus sp. BWB1-3]|uniref:glycosyltransferase family 8 protein n=1 Tax=unclassified Enterococcus TaxID=2608891 RepID=UPI001921F0D0|nr:MULTISPECIES: glycosyltransferase family 8 protein [unclassified Enterococcus]MBL1230597.1 glycosyltransferase family 8 protein [Enterococcus sp. BWB1-3]MCB5950902.1 glycosyltransferase family 8 protein [Enterococcus sp. BWT-B8]
MDFYKVPVVTASDEHYAPYLSVMIATLLDNVNDPNSRIHFYVIDDDISDKSKEQLRKTVNLHSDQASIEFVSVDHSLYKDFLVSDHITTTAYFRISLPKFLPADDTCKVLYLDADTLILDDITTLFNLDLHDQTIGAVIDPGQTKALKRLGIDSNNFYFNSGVMVINLERWNKENITEKTIQFLTDHGDKIIYHDQDALNAVLYEQWAPFHPRWNMQSSLIFEKHPAPNEHYTKLYKAGSRNPAVIHFTGHDKPWNTLENHPYQDLYMKKLSESILQKGEVSK